MRLGNLMKELQTLLEEHGPNITVMGADHDGPILGCEGFGAVGKIKKVKTATVYLQDKDRIQLYNKDGSKRSKTMVVIA